MRAAPPGAPYLSPCLPAPGRRWGHLGTRGCVVLQSGINVDRLIEKKKKALKKLKKQQKKAEKEKAKRKKVLPWRGGTLWCHPAPSPSCLCMRWDQWPMGLPVQSGDTR